MVEVSGGFLKGFCSGAPSHYLTKGGRRLFKHNTHRNFHLGKSLVCTASEGWAKQTAPLSLIPNTSLVDGFELVTVVGKPSPPPAHSKASLWACSQFAVSHHAAASLAMANSLTLIIRDKTDSSPAFHSADAAASIHPSSFFFFLLVEGKQFTLALNLEFKSREAFVFS